MDEDKRWAFVEADVEDHMRAHQEADGSYSCDPHVMVGYVRNALQFVARMDWAAEAIARTGAGKCWECGASIPLGAVPLEADDLLDEDPRRLYCDEHIPSRGIRRQQCAAVQECFDLTASALGVDA